MKFTTPCFVRVENPQERKELIEWLEGIGYIFPVGFNGARGLAESSYSPTVYVGAENRGGIGICFAFSLEEPLKKGWGIDCGTNIPLFKALAAMNDENYIEQWFIMNDELLPPETIFRSNIHPTLYRKATYEEIINHFKNQQL